MNRKKEEEKSEKVPDFPLEHFDTMEEETIFQYRDKKGEKRGKAFSVKDEDLIRLKEGYESEGEIKTKKGFNLYSALHIDQLFNSLKKLARTLGWDIKESKEVKKLKEEVKEKSRTIENLKRMKRKQEKALEELRNKSLNNLVERIEDFEQDVKEFRKKIEKARKEDIKEKELQKFLKKRPWLFGYEYINSEPQKQAGSMDQFDFYLEKYSGTNDVIEIKKVSDPILKKRNGELRAKVAQAIDQCIEYLWTTKEISHSTGRSKKEGIKELRPRGKIIIGNDASNESKRKLDKWNFQLNNIKILTYHDLLDKAETTLKKIKEEKNE